MAGKGSEETNAREGGKTDSGRRQRATGSKTGQGAGGGRGGRTGDGKQGLSEDSGQTMDRG